MKKKYLSIIFVFLCSLVIFFNKSTSLSVKASNEEVSISNSNLNLLAECSEEEANLISYDYETGTMKYLYFNNSIAAAENNISDVINNSTSPLSIIDDDDRTMITDASVAPYKYVAQLYTYINKETTEYGYGSAFFIGPNILLTAAHCVFSDTLDKFEAKIKILPGRSQKENPFGTFWAKKVYIQKEYRHLPAGENDRIKYDWAVIVMERNESLISSLNGNFGKISNYISNNLEIYMMGYPKVDFNYFGNLFVAPGKVMQKNSNSLFFYHSCDSNSGASGGPILVKINNVYYAVGIHVSSGGLNGGVMIDSFIYLLTNSLLADNCIEVKDYYIEGTNDVQYNCLVKVIINPSANARIEVSSDGNNYNTSYSKLTELFYATSTNSTKGNIPYDYYRTYYNDTKTYSSVRRITTTHSTDEISAKYAIVNRTASGNVIATDFDKSSNVWKHNGKNGKTIKGTIAYNGEAKNIEVSIPFIGYKKSVEVEVGGITFQLRTGPNKVSIKASRELKCDENTIVFAFGVN